MLGTICGFIVAFLCNWLLVNKKDKNDNMRIKRNLYRDKLEKAYMASVRIDDWLIEAGSNVSKMVNVFLSDATLQKIVVKQGEFSTETGIEISKLTMINPANELKMLIDIYGEDCTNKAEVLITELESLQEEYRRIIVSAMIIKNTLTRNDEYIDIAKTEKQKVLKRFAALPLKKIYKIKKDFQVALKEEIKKYI